MGKILLVTLIAALALAGFYMSFSKQQQPLLSYSENQINEFQSWMKKYNKKYSSADLEVYRMEIFTENLQKIQTHNRLDKQWKMGANQFMDMTQDEFKATYLGFKSTPKPISYIPYENGTPTNINWVQKGVVTPIKNQGSCGSCWAFSTTGDLEGVYAINKGTLLSFSEQQLVDCSSSYGNMGCNGGEMDNAFEYSIDYGNEQESQYPYLGYDSTCQYNEADKTAVITAYSNVPSGNCQSLGQQLVAQPVSIAVDASNWSFYLGGVFDDCGDDLDHGVLLVGVQDNGSGQGYWLVKNSWGTSWGEDGYIRLALGNTCGMCNDASTGTL